MACNDTTDAGPPCSIIECIPPVETPQAGACPTWTYAVYGSAAECGAADGGLVPVSRCASLCPALPGDAGFAAQNPISCSISPGRNLVCEYAQCPG